MDVLSLRILGLPLQKWLQLILLLLIIGLGATIAYLPISREEPFDDAFMFIRYAFNVWEYGVFGWNSDQPTYGCTSIAYVFSTAFLMKLGLLSKLKQVSLLLIQSSIYYFLGLFLVHQSNVLILRDQKKFVREILLLTLLQLLLAAIFRRNITGMDTTMAFFSNALMIYASFRYLKRKQASDLFLFGLSAFFTFLVRPDNGLYALLYPALFMWVHEKNRQAHIFIFSTLAMCFVVDSWVKYAYFGHILPLPFYVKAQGFYEAYLGIDIWNTWLYLAEFLRYLFPSILISFVIFRKTLLKKLLPALIPLLLTQAYFLTTIPVMGFESRLLVPSIPFVICIAMILLNEFEFERLKAPRPLLKRAILGIIILTSMILGLRIGGKQYFGWKKRQVETVAEAFPLPLEKRYQNPQLDLEALYLVNDLIKAEAGPDFVFAATEHGFISSQNPKMDILCLVGLHNVNSLAGRALNSEELDLSLRAYQPDLIWMPHYDYPALNYHLIHAPFFQKQYELYYGLLEFGIAVRKDSPYHDGLMERLQELYQEPYLIPNRY